MKTTPPNLFTLPNSRLDKIAKTLDSCIAKVESALQSKPKCSTGMMINQQTLGTIIGPSGGPEVLTLIYADDPNFLYR
jgi:hypothetical protein